MNTRISQGDKEWYSEQRGVRLVAWIAINVGVFIVYYKTDSILWALVWSIGLGLIRKAPTLWEIDRIEREIKQEQQPATAQVHARIP